MHVRVIEDNGIKIARIESNATIFEDVDAALDLMATVRHETGCDRMIVDAHTIDSRFFELRTGLAGDILQKYVTYMMRLAIVGDFSKVTSKSLRDFIYESNKGNHVMFVTDDDAAVTRFSTTT